MNPASVWAEHLRCRHSVYLLSCDEFEQMLTRAGGCCEICGTKSGGHDGKIATRLVIDHDHAKGDGRNHARGMLCRRCNRRIAQVDSGDRTPTEAEARYLVNAWCVINPPTRASEVFDINDPSPVTLTVKTTCGIATRLSAIADRKPRSTLVAELLAWFAREPGAKLPTRPDAPPKGTP